MVKTLPAKITSVMVDVLRHGGRAQAGGGVTGDDSSLAWRAHRGTVAAHGQVHGVVGGDDGLLGERAKAQRPRDGRCRHNRRQR